MDHSSLLKLPKNQGFYFFNGLQDCIESHFEHSQDVHMHDFYSV